MVSEESSQEPRVRELTVTAVANELGVHYMTAYRYVRLGKLPARKEGRDWKISQDDLTRFISTSTAGDPELVATSRGDRFLNRLIAFDQQGAWSVIEAALASGLDPIGAYTTIVIPAMSELGDRWVAGQLTVAEEHVATGICQRIVGRLGPMVARRGIPKGTIVLACPANEPHGLPTAIAADTLRAAGYGVINCGPNVPLDSLIRLSSNTPRLLAIGVSATSTDNEPAIARTIAALRDDLEVPVILGGRGVGSFAMAQELGADLWAPSAVEGVTQLDQTLGASQASINTSR